VGKQGCRAGRDEREARRERTSAGERFRSLLVYTARLLIAIVAFLSLRSAADAGVAVAPMQQWVYLRPGEEAPFSLTLTNVPRSHSAPIAMTVEVTDFGVSPDGTLSFGPEKAHERSAVRWIRLDAGTLVLGPSESRKVEGTVRAPPNAEGDYWAAVLVTLDGPRGGRGVNLVLRTASGVFVRVSRGGATPRPVIRNLEITLPRLSADEDSVASNVAGRDEQAFRLSVEAINDGIYSFEATGIATLYRDGRRKVATIPLHTSRRRILPGDMRRLIGVLASPLPAGSYTAKVILTASDAVTRRAFAEQNLEISPDLAGRWAQVPSSARTPGLTVERTALQYVLSPGRFTADSILIRNGSDSTMSVRCSYAPVSLPDAWVALSPTEFTLGPCMQRSVACRLNIPDGIEPGEYTGDVLFEAQVASLEGTCDRSLRRLPVAITLQRTIASSPRGSDPRLVSHDEGEADEKQ